MSRFGTITRNGLIRPFIEGSQFSIYDPDALTFFTAASITDTTQKSAVNTLVLSLKAANIWTKMKALYPIVGGSASSHAVNLKQPGTYNLSFSTGWTHSSTGMTPNGATFANTNLVADSVLTYGSACFSYYSRTNSDGNFSDLGSYGTAGNNYKSYVLQSRNSNLSKSGIYDGSGTLDWATGSNASSLGFFAANRTSPNVNRIFKNGISLGLNTFNSNYGSLSNIYSIVLGGANNGTIIQYTNRECAFASIGNGLTDAEVLSFYNAVQTYQTNLGRQV